MVRGFAMESQDKRMCKAETVFPSVTVDYNHRAYDEDCFGDILNLFDFPMESLEGDGFAEDWASKLGPIPSEVFKELMPLGPKIDVGNNFTSSANLPFEYPVLNNRPSQLKYELNREEEVNHIRRISQLKQHPTFVEVKRVYPSQTSPNSVLESRSSSSNNNNDNNNNNNNNNFNNNSTDNSHSHDSNKGVSFGIEILIPARSRTKRRRPTTNPWLRLPLTMLTNKDKKGRKPPLPSVFMETKRSHERADVAGIMKCAHCEITKTPQWREGPMGPKTLCNACGVRYRSGRLYPEYRPAASPTFVPALHSNSHRKVIEMRQKAK
ncbi:GATA transcription factor 10-like [Rutidosis leptorrhynchoides]|uniref:GATA transcription factor 10-like n=1 Tax=Rutidosis leptorrhynchoides TaxID=125765 RepID=UPI003A99D3E4